MLTKFKRTFKRNFRHGPWEPFLHESSSNVLIAKNRLQAKSDATVKMKMSLESARNLVINIPEPVCIHTFGLQSQFAIAAFRIASNILRTLDNKFLSRLIWSENKTWSIPVSLMTDSITSGDEKVI